MGKCQGSRIYIDSLMGKYLGYRMYVLLVVVIKPYCRIGFRLVHSSLRSGELQNHTCGRSDIGAEKSFLIPSMVLSLVWSYLSLVRDKTKNGHT